VPVQGSGNRLEQHPYPEKLRKTEENSFTGIGDGSYVYFVHSFYAKAEDESYVAARTDYCLSFDSAVEKGKLFACQFHPEKSGEVGMKILENFLSC